MILSVLATLLSAAGLVALDQILKAWATSSLQPAAAMELLPGIVEMRYTVNDGAAFSMLSGKQTLLIVVTSIALVAVLALLVFRKLTSPERLAWTLILAGGIGNLIDRILHGQVVDYINVLFMNFAVFNFADICVTLGVAVLLITLLTDGRSKNKKDKQAPAAEPEQPAVESDTPDAEA